MASPQHQGRSFGDQGDRQFAFSKKPFHWHAGGVMVEGTEFECENPMAALHDSIHARMERMRGTHDG